MIMQIKVLFGWDQVTLALALRLLRLRRAVDTICRAWQRLVFVRLQPTVTANRQSQHQETSLGEMLLDLFSSTETPPRV